VCRWLLDLQHDQPATIAVKGQDPYSSIMHLWHWCANTVHHLTTCVARHLCVRFSAILSSF
jgi:hypothetical protein